MNRVLALLGVIASCAAAPARTSMPSLDDGAARRNEACVGCHAEEAAAWGRSMHRRSFTNAAFQTAFAHEPTTFCRDCHAPAEVADIGVACVSCHAVAAAASHPATKNVDCGRCHEFASPGAPPDDERRLMQATMREHARSPAASEACTTCHRSHGFAEVRDPAWLASELDVKTELVGRAARVTLTQTRAGHGFPTGDLFRRLAVTAEARAADGRVLTEETRYLARRFETRPGRPGREMVADDRVFAEPVTIELPVPSEGATVAWSVKLERVASVGAGAAPANAAIESDVLLHSGVIQR